LNATNLRGYLRDEVYAFEIVFLLKNGKQTDGFHIPGRIKGPAENLQPDVPDTNPDFIGVPDYTSGGVGYSPYWKIYNTGSVLGTSPGYSPASDYRGPYQYGEFGYWESTDTYPCNKDVWGDLAGQPIRHHKFPDINVSPAYESKIFTGPSGMVQGNDAVFPIGVQLDVQLVSSLIQTSTLTPEQKDDIVAFKIIRADRGTNKSIVAKGILRNVNTYEREEETYYYPNYPYNDLNSDPFLNTTNNAYSQICDGYTVFIDTLGLDPAGGPSFAEVEYTDCNTNKATKKKYFAIGQYPLCSIGKPTILGPATGRVGLSTYEIWTAQVCNPSPFAFARGGRIEYNDIYTGVTTLWVNGWPTSPVYTLYVVPGTGGPVQIEGPGEICFTGPTLVTGANCKAETPQPGFTEKYRQIFNSPETSFGQPFLGGVLKLESVMFGRGKGHFVEVRDNAKYKLLTEEAQRDALESAEELGDQTTPFNATAMFTAYQAYLTIYVNGITRKNYAYSFNSIGDYNYGVGVPDDQGIKQRNLDIARYLIPGVQNVGDIYNINNFQRESSVYLRTDLDRPALPFPDQSPNMLSAGSPIVTDISRFTISERSKCQAPAKEEDMSVVSYYASLKNVFVNQYGQIYSYSTVDTGFQVLVDDTTPDIQTVFGGDTFISRFAFKTKLPFFIDNRVNAPDDSDIFYDEIGNIAYPKYWHSARSILRDYTITSVGVLSNIISYKAHNFDCPNSQFVAPGQPKDSNPGRTFYDGYFYLFAYGIPNFYCESSYNVDLRQAFNSREGDFWPHVSTGIPDDWVQQSYVPIVQDNTYYYNVTYSKQNRENTFTNLPIDWDRPCFTYYPFRAIYSDSQNIDSDNRVNSWLIYRAISYYDFPQNYGNLVSLDGIQNKAVLARFENKTLLYNNLLTIDTSNPQAAYVGNPQFFRSAPPIDFAETDLGYVGTQNKMLLKIPQGQVSVDAKRGQVFLVTGTQAVDLSGFGSGLNRFFTDHLAFEILRYFPDVPTDNHFTGIGLHGVFDSKYDRVLITKLDYVPKSKDVKYDAVKREFYIETQYRMPSEDLFYSVVRERVYLTDEKYFCNKSWTVSFNFNTKSWISFHSYIPNWYIGENNFFYSGLNGCCDDFEVIAGVPGPVPTTTTTSSTSTTSTSSTTTTTTTKNCNLAGTVTETNCTLSGTAVVTVPEPPPPCERPDELIEDVFFTGYNIVSPPSNVDSTVSQSAACNAVAYLNTFGGSYVNVVPTFLTIVYEGLYLGSGVFVTNGTTDCTTIPDGWYFTGASQSVNTVFQVIGGLIVYITSCTTTTTTSTSSTTTTTSSTTTTTSTSSTTTTTTTAIPVTTTTTSSSSSTTTTTTTTGTPTTTTTTTTSLPPVACGVASSYSGAEGYPITQSVTLGSTTGTVDYSFDAYSVPDRFIVRWNSNVVIDTGYRGTSDYDFGGANRASFNADLNGQVDPITLVTYPDAINYPDDGYPRVTSPGGGITSFNKNLASPTSALVEVYAPMPGTAWQFTMSCPGTTTTTTTAVAPDCSLAGTAVEEEPPPPLP
jgi:hypothetical protein